MKITISIYTHLSHVVKRVCSMNKVKISIIIPCYYAEKSIAGVVEQTISELNKCDRYNYEFILVNDGSEDTTFYEIQQLSLKFPFVTGIDLAKNCGQHNAILAGMQYADGDYILGMDDDFQTHPSQIFRLIDKLEEGYDIVYGRFPKRHHGLVRNIESRLSHLSVCYLLDKPKDLMACPMYIIRRFVRDEIIKSESSFTNLQGLFLRTSSKIGNADIDHFDRKYGKSGYTLKKLMRLWASLLNYSMKPMRLILGLGLFFLVAGLLYLLIAIISGAGFEHKVYSEIVVFSGVIVFAVGIIGEYVIRMFMTVTKEPQYVIRRDTRNKENPPFYEGEYGHTVEGAEISSPSNKQKMRGAVYEKETAYSGRG